MLKFFNYDIVFQEIPDEVTLAINITHCPIGCHGCHSKFLWEDTGEPLNEESLTILLGQYACDITCVAFMGGDREPEEVNRLAEWLRENYSQLKTAWYSGRTECSKAVLLKNMDYIKLGPYKEDCGGLKSKTTNQRFYKVQPDLSLEDITFKFWKK